MKFKIVPDKEGKYYCVEMYNDKDERLVTIEGFDTQASAQAYTRDYLVQLYNTSKKKEA